MANRWPLVLLGTLISCLGSLSVQGQQPEGSEFQADTLTATPPVLLQDAEIATAADGRAIVVWRSSRSAGSDTSSSSIQGRLVDALGSPAGDQFQVNTFTTGTQGLPDVSMAPTGEFVVAWSNYGVGGNDPARGIHGQLFTSTGVPLGSPFQIGGDSLIEPSVAMYSDGFVVVWGEQDVFGQLFDSNGSMNGGQIMLNSYTSGNQSFAEVAVGDEGHFVVTWTSDGSAGNDDQGTSIQVRRFDSNGLPLGSEAQVNSYTTGGQLASFVSMDEDDDFVVAWVTNEAQGNSIRGQRFASDGQPQGGEISVSEGPAQEQGNPGIAMDRLGNFMVVWDRFNPNTSEGAAFGRQFSADGVAIGDVLQVQSELPGGQNNPAVAPWAPGKFVVAWDSYLYEYGNPNTFEHIRGQRFRDTLFEDGFESGDTLGWSTAVP